MNHPTISATWHLELADHGDAENSSIRSCSPLRGLLHRFPPVTRYNRRRRRATRKRPLPTSALQHCGRPRPQFASVTNTGLATAVAAGGSLTLFASNPGRVGEQSPHQRDRAAAAQQQPVQYISAAGGHPDPGVLREPVGHSIRPAIRCHGDRQRLKLHHFHRSWIRLPIAPTAARLRPRRSPQSP